MRDTIQGERENKKEYHQVPGTGYCSSFKQQLSVRRSTACNTTKLINYEYSSRENSELALHEELYFRMCCFAYREHQVQLLYVDHEVLTFS